MNRYLGIVLAMIGVLLTAGGLRADDAALLPNGIQYYMDNNGRPLANGKVYYYTPSTTTPKTTWTSASKATPQANPVQLGVSGRPTNPIYGDGSYRQVVKDQFNNTIWDFNTASTGSGGGGSSTATGDGDLVGTIKPWAGATAPNQYAFTYGQEVSRTTYAALFTAITSAQSVFCTSGSPVLTGLSDTNSFWTGMTVEVGCLAAGNSTVISKTSSTVTLAANANVSTTVTATFFPWGRGNGVTTFNLPDFRGVVPVGNNIMGGVASANLTSTYFSGQDPNSAGALGGSQSTALGAGNLPAHTHTSPTVNDPGHSHNILVGSSGGATDHVTQGDNGASSPVSPPVVTNTTGITLSASTGTNASGTSIPFSRVQPSRTTNYIIKITPDTNSATATGVTSLGGMTGDIACGSGLTCTGNTVSVAAPAANIPAVPIENYGGGCAVSDNTTPLLAAVASVTGGVRILFNQNCTYRFIGTDLIVFSKAVMLEGTGQSHTVLQYSPSASGTFLNWNNGVNIMYSAGGAGLRNMSLSIGPSVYATNMIMFADVSGFTMENVNVGWGYGGVIGSGSTCVYSKGREFGYFSNLNLQCDRPLRLGQNPNAYGAADFFNYHNLYLNASATYPAVTVDDGGTIANTAFNDISMPQGTHGFYWPGLGARSSVAAVTAAGSGYTVNVPVTLTGGTCSTAIQVRPLTVNGSGGILTASIANPGVCSVVPPNPVSAASGGAAFTLDNPISYRLSFNNIRTEQGDDATAFSFYIAPANTLYGLTIRDTVLDSERCGIYLRNTRETVIQGVDHLYTVTGCATSVNADASNDILSYVNNFWHTGHTQTLLQIPVRYDASPSGTSATIPPSAYYNTTFNYTYAQSLGVVQEFKQYGATNTVTLTVPAAVASDISNVWGSVAGTIVTSATAPLAVDASTGAVSCSTCSSIGQVATVATTTNANFYPLFVASSANSTQVVNLDASGLTYNPSSDTLSIGTTGLYSFGGTANISAQNSGNSMALTSVLSNVSSGIGMLFLPNITSSSAITMYGRRMTVTSQADANTTALYGDYVILDTTVNNASTLTNSTGYLIGQRLQGSSTAANVITSSIGLNIAATSVGGFSGSNLTISNVYGDKIDNQGSFCSTAGVTCGASYGLFVSAQTNADAAAYSIFTAGAGLAHISDTTGSSNSTTAALTLDGGLSIALATDASSSTNGGTFTTAGGAAIAKSAYIGTYASIGTKIRAAGSAPALSSCGTGSPAIVGSDLAGEVTMGTNATGCVITFNAAYSSAPYCTVTWIATPLASQSYSVSTTAITTVQTSTSGNKLNYHCIARSAG